jgi:two-component system, LytTR family, response regulator
MIRTIIIDDEPLAIDSLALLLRKHCSDDVTIVATTNSPRIGKKLIDEHCPDLVFVDIEMPGLSGIDLIKSFNDPSFRVVFVTAFDAYAIDALRLSALDYLLKPVDADDIVKVIGKVKWDISVNENLIKEQLQRLQRILLQTNNKADGKIGIGMVDKIVFINISDIIYCEANGAYTTIYLQDGKSILSSKTLGSFETQLTPHKFFRIHHSTLININRIKEFQRYDGGYVLMETNARLEISSRRRKDFLELINSIIS